MLTRYWGIILTFGIAVAGAIGIAIFAYPSPPSLDHLQYEQARNPNYHAGGDACQPSRVEAIPDWGERLRKRESCAKEAEDYRLQSNDLIQQTRAASAAEAQARLAAQGLWLTFVQTIGGYITLVAAGAAAIYAREAAKHTQAGADQAKRSADAAFSAIGESAEANEIARNAAIEERRAWIKISPRITNVAEIEGRILINVYVYGENIGASPASNVRICIKSFSATDNEERTKYFASLATGPETPAISAGNILPGAMSERGIGSHIEFAVGDIKHTMIIAGIFYNIAGDPERKTSIGEFEISQPGPNGHVVPFGFNGKYKTSVIGIHGSGWNHFT